MARGRMSTRDFVVGSLVRDHVVLAHGALEGGHEALIEPGLILGEAQGARIGVPALLGRLTAQTLVRRLGVDRMQVVEQPQPERLRVGVDGRIAVEATQKLCVPGLVEFLDLSMPPRDRRRCRG